MPRAEQAHQFEVENSRPTPGTLRHVEYLAELPIPTYFNRNYMRDFLKETRAEKSLSILIKQQRTYRPIRSPDIDFDSRQLGFDHPGLPTFSGTIHRNPSLPNESHLRVYGEPPPWATDGENLSYAFFIPTFFNSTYDPSRPISAAIKHMNGEPKSPEVGREEVYNELSAVEYSEADPKILIRCIKYAARDLSTILSYIYYGVEPGIDVPEAELEHGPGEIDQKRLAAGLGLIGLGAAVGFLAGRATHKTS